MPVLGIGRKVLFMKNLTEWSTYWRISWVLNVDCMLNYIFEQQHLVREVSLGSVNAISLANKGLSCMFFGRKILSEYIHLIVRCKFATLFPLQRWMVFISANSWEASSAAGPTENELMCKSNKRESNFQNPINRKKSRLQFLLIVIAG